ncbi:TPA: hypothetical protein RTH11_000442 [Campylobacter jejuni]|nr:hypothetical protein [Campylobacter jejuni]
MKKILFSLGCLVAFAFANEFSQDEMENKRYGYQGCKAYPSWHYKSCQTQNQSVYQQTACYGFGICNW